MLNTIQTGMIATFRKIDWNAWKRMVRFLLYGSSTRKITHVIQPAR